MFTLPCRHRAIHEKTQVHTKEKKATSRKIHTSTRIIPDRHTGIYVNKRVYNIQRGTKTDKIYLSTQYPGTRVPVPVGTSTLPPGYPGTSTGRYYVMIVSVHTMAGLAARRLRPFWRMHDASDVTRRMWFSV